MTPAIQYAKKANIYYTLHHYDHSSSCEQYGQEAVEKLRISSNRMLKTLVIVLNGVKYAIAVLPVSMQLDFKAAAAVFGVKKVKLADEKEAMRSTGYIIGGISPLGQKRKLATIIDKSALNYETIYISAGRRGLVMELNPMDLQVLTKGKFAFIGRN